MGAYSYTAGPGTFSSTSPGDLGPSAPGAVTPIYTVLREDCRCSHYDGVIP